MSRSADPEADPGAPPDEAEVVVVAPASFDDFYRREHARVVGLAYVLCGRRSVAEELAQEAFLATYRRWTEIEEPAAWVRRVVANRATSTLRRRSSEARAMVQLRLRRDDPAPELATGDDELWAEVRRLPRRQAQALALRYVDGASVAEVAAALGVSENTVKTHLSRGKQTLADRLEDRR